MQYTQRILLCTHLTPVGSQPTKPTSLLEGFSLHPNPILLPCPCTLNLFTCSSGHCLDIRPALLFIFVSLFFPHFLLFFLIYYTLFSLQPHPVCLHHNSCLIGHLWLECHPYHIWMPGVTLPSFLVFGFLSWYPCAQTV